jgi:two-component system nitrogen regulation sensor histidine kinase GlnL
MMLSNLSLDLLSTTILVINQDYQLIDYNSSAQELLGLSSHTKKQNLFKLIDFNIAQETFKALIQKTRFIEDIQLSIDSKSILANIMISSLEVESNLYLLLEIQTSNHPKQIQKSEQLQQQSRISDSLIQNLAHEIKNPLGGIKGAAQLLERKLPKDFSTRYSQIIIQETERLDQLVNRLLLPVEKEVKQQSNIHKIIDKALDIIALQNTQPIQVKKDYDPSLPEIQVSAEQVQQVLINLIKNSYEAISNDGEITLRTRIIHQKTIGNTQHKHVIRIDVIDNGCGIPDALAKDIFFPTISGKNSSGLGLSIAQSLIQRNAGIIELNTHQKETCFSIYLPVQPGENNQYG